MFWISCSFPTVKAIILIRVHTWLCKYDFLAHTSTHRTAVYSSDNFTQHAIILKHYKADICIPAVRSVHIWFETAVQQYNVYLSILVVVQMISYQQCFTLVSIISNIALTVSSFSTTQPKQSENGFSSINSFFIIHNDRPLHLEHDVNCFSAGINSKTVRVKRDGLVRI